MSLVLVNWGFPQAKELLRKLSAVWARALRRILQACARPKILKNISLKGAKLLFWPGSQINIFSAAQMIRAGPEIHYIFKLRNKTYC